MPVDWDDLIFGRVSRYGTDEDMSRIQAHTQRARDGTIRKDCDLGKASNLCVGHAGFPGEGNLAALRRQ
jgi:hypothetical protein